MKNFIRFIAVLLFLLLSCSGIASAQGRLQEIAKASIPEKVTLGPDGKGIVEVKMKIKAGWWSYSINETRDKDGAGPEPTQFALLSPSFIKVDGKVKQSQPKVLFDHNFGFKV